MAALAENQHLPPPDLTAQDIPLHPVNRVATAAAVLVQVGMALRVVQATTQNLV